MMAMGYFIVANKKSLKQNSFKGLKIFGLGFLLNIGLNFNLLLKIKFQNWNIDPFQYIFGVDTFYLAGLSILILSLLKVLKKSQIPVLLSLTFLFVLFILVTYFAPFGFKTSIDLESYYHHNFYFPLWATSLTML